MADAATRHDVHGPFTGPDHQRRVSVEELQRGTIVARPVLQPVLIRFGVVKGTLGQEFAIVETQPAKERTRAVLAIQPYRASHRSCTSSIVVLTLGSHLRSYALYTDSIAGLPSSWM